MGKIKIEKWYREYCSGCGVRKLELNVLFFPYATTPIYVCDKCKKDLNELLNIQ